MFRYLLCVRTCWNIDSVSSSDIMAIRKDYKKNNICKIKLQLHALKTIEIKTHSLRQRCKLSIFCHDTIPMLPVQQAKPVFCKTQCGQSASETAEGVLPYWVGGSWALLMLFQSPATGNSSKWINSKTCLSVEVNSLLTLCQRMNVQG